MKENDMKIKTVSNRRAVGSAEDESEERGSVTKGAASDEQHGVGSMKEKRVKDKDKNIKRRPKMGYIRCQARKRGVVWGYQQRRTRKQVQSYLIKIVNAGEYGGNCGITTTNESMCGDVRNAKENRVARRIVPPHGQYPKYNLK